MSDERADAIVLANRLLDEPNCDLDDDLRVLSRQLLRREEYVAAMAAAGWATCESGAGTTPKVVLLFPTLEAAQKAHKFVLWSVAAPEKPTYRYYHFKRFRGTREMAEGAVTQAASEAEALTRVRGWYSYSDSFKLEKITDSALDSEASEAGESNVRD